jgi:hypothetical protein
MIKSIPFPLQTCLLFIDDGYSETGVLDSELGNMDMLGGEVKVDFDS